MSSCRSTTFLNMYVVLTTLYPDEPRDQGLARDRPGDPGHDGGHGSSPWPRWRHRCGPSPSSGPAAERALERELAASTPTVSPERRRRAGRDAADAIGSRRPIGPGAVPARAGGYVRRRCAPPGSPPVRRRRACRARPPSRPGPSPVVRASSARSAGSARGSASGPSGRIAPTPSTTSPRPARQARRCGSSSCSSLDPRDPDVPPVRAVPDALRRGLPRPDRDGVPAGLALRDRPRHLRVDPSPPGEVRDGRRTRRLGRRSGHRDEQPRRRPSSTRPSSRATTIRTRRARGTAIGSTSSPVRSCARTTSRPARCRDDPDRRAPRPSRSTPRAISCSSAARTARSRPSTCRRSMPCAGARPSCRPTRSSSARSRLDHAPVRPRRRLGRDRGHRRRQVATLDATSGEILGTVQLSKVGRRRARRDIADSGQRARPGQGPEGRRIGPGEAHRRFGRDLPAAAGRLGRSAGRRRRSRAPVSRPPSRRRSTTSASPGCRSSPCPRSPSPTRTGSR